MKVLLHTCCAPCASHCALALREQGHKVALFYSNANIAPHEEFERRLAAVELLARKIDAPLHVDTPDHNAWLADVAAGFEEQPEKGTRCARCFNYSLQRTWAAMAALGMERFTTTLTVSPHKHSPTLLRLGAALDSERFLPLDFKKRGGFQRSMQLADEFDLYRQCYCGCEFSHI